MKKKFLSLVSLMLAVVMMMPAAVFANTDVVAPGSEGTETVQTLPEFKISSGDTNVTTVNLYTNSTVNTVKLSVPAEYTNVLWSSADKTVAKVDAETGDVTAVGVGETTIYAEDRTAGVEATCKVVVAARTQSVTAVDDSKVVKQYVMGQKFNPAGLSVEVTYNDTGKKTITSFTLKNDVALKMGDTEVVVVGEGGIEVKIEGITVIAQEVTGVEVLDAKKTYTEGEKISGIKLKVTFNDKSTIEMTDGFTVSVDRALTVADNNTTVTVSYGGKSDTFTIKVNAKATTPPASGDTTATGTIKYEPADAIPKIYEVGEKIDFSKVTKFSLVKADGTAVTSVASSTIKTALEGKLTAFTSVSNDTDVTLTFTIGSDKYVLALNDLKVIEKEEDENKDDEDGPYEIRDVEMLKDKYEVGYEFDLEDIDFVEVKWTRNGTAYEIEGKDLDDYDANPTIEVLDKDGDTKSRTYRDTIEEDDVLTDRYGDKYVQLLLTFGEETYEFDVEVGSDPIQFIHRNKVIITYDDIEDALEATLEQDKDVDTDKFDLEDDVTTSRPITLKLGENAELDDDFEYDPAHPVIIDLNGYTLTIHTTTVDMSRKNDGNLTITNSSKTAGKVIYDDIEVTVTVAEDEELVFEYDAETVPGIYTVEVTWGKNGSVTSKPSMDKNDTIEAGVGTEITFTIKPVSGYQLDAIKADGKAVAASAYTKATNGTVTYKYKVGEANGKIEVAFKEIVVEKPAWKNPYTDVRSTASYLGAVEFVTENELMNGTSSTTFSPTKTMNRAMFVTVLGRLAGVDTSKYTKSSFIDVPLNSSTSWYAPYVEWANQNGIIQGYGNGKFGPMDEITHQQLYTIVYRYAVFVENVRFTPGTTTITVSDKNDIDSYAIDGVKFATAKDLLVTSGGKITPKSGALRWELATVLQLFCENVLGWEDAE